MFSIPLSFSQHLACVFWCFVCLASQKTKQEKKNTQHNFMLEKQQQISLISFISLIEEGETTKRKWNRKNNFFLGLWRKLCAEEILMPEFFGLRKCFSFFFGQSFDKFLMVLCFYDDSLIINYVTSYHMPKNTKLRRFILIN